MYVSKLVHVILISSFPFKCALEWRVSAVQSTLVFMPIISESGGAVKFLEFGFVFYVGSLSIGGQGLFLIRD